ncbi:FAD-dependent oxidoreductase [Halorubrum sp. RMP-47]|uniref:NAD(P)/FAD-dependent oxidoreductase n=1 Tax=Halorubrum miltondacostae TaxID=3076378 RepID=UPI003529CC5F
MNVLVCGGGIVGLAAAHALAERGADVTLCEQGSLGGGSTARSAGGIRSQFSTRINVELSLFSKAVWNSFEDQFDVDIGFRTSGYLFLARSESVAERFRDDAQMQRDLGAETEFLDPAAATEVCPELKTDRFRAATFNPTDGFADPNLAVQGYAEAARDLGAVIRPKTAVTAIHQSGDRVVGVDVVKNGTTERIDVDYVVNATGAWSSRFADMAGTTLPISPRRRQIAVVDPSKRVPESVPLTIDMETGSYFRPERDGAALVGGHFTENDHAVNPDGYDQSMEMAWAAEAVEGAADCAAYFGPETRIKRGWAGLYAVTPDNHPIIEETLPGLVTAAGFSGHGFQHAPATARIVSDLIFDGDTDLVDVSKLAADRFGNGSPLDEQSVA